MYNVPEGLKDVAVVIDEILVWGTTKQENDESLKSLLHRCSQHDLRLNLKNVSFLAEPRAILKPHSDDSGVEPRSRTGGGHTRCMRTQIAKETQSFS